MYYIISDVEFHRLEEGYRAKTITYDIYGATVPLSAIGEFYECASRFNMTMSLPKLFAGGGAFYVNLWVFSSHQQVWRRIVGLLYKKHTTKGFTRFWCNLQLKFLCLMR